MENEKVSEGGDPEGERPNIEKDGERPDTKTDGERPENKTDGGRPDTKTDGGRPGFREIDQKIDQKTSESKIISPESKMSDDDRASNGERTKWYGYNKVQIPYIEDYDDFNTWVKVVTAWTKTTNIPKAEQGFTLVQDLPKSSKRYGSRLREDVFKNCPPDELIEDEEGVTKVIAYLKTRFWVDLEKDVYDTHAKFKRIARKKGQSIIDYVLEFDNTYTKAKQLKIAPKGDDYDMCLALDLMITADLTEYEYLIVKSQADVLNEDGKRYETVKRKMREIFGKKGASQEQNNEEAFLTNSNKDDDISKNDEIYLSKGWRPPQNKRYQNGNNRYQKYKPNQSNWDSNKSGNKTVMRTKPTNPNGPDGKPMKCLSCRAVTHLIKDCPDAYENRKQKNNRKFKPVYVVNQETEEEEKVLIELSDTESENEKEIYCSVYCADNPDDLSSFTVEALNKAALDTCATANIAGEKWTKIYLNALPKNLRKKVKGPSQSPKQFVFGNQGKLKSLGKYVIPVKIGGEDNEITIDVISSDIPLLLSKGEMKRLGMVLDIKNDKGYINDKPLMLMTTNAGHYVVDLLNEKEKMEEVHIAELDGDEGERVQMKALTKIHRQFGHRSKHQFTVILKEAGKWQDKFSKMIDKIMDSCEGCILRSKTPDRPAVAPPLANDFGNVLGIDLKIWDKNRGIYILYMIDLFTRYQVATIIKKKLPEEVVKAITTKWLPTFGRFDKILSDNGGEFNGDEIREMASALDVELLTTGANSPWQNGTVERNHMTTDSIINAVLRDYPNMNLETALAWAITAVNAMSSVRGFSPYQLVFGKNIRLPNILEDPPAAWEEPEKSKQLIDTLNAIHTARKAYTAAERCERIKKALKAKIRVSDTIYNKGDNVYFKKEGCDTWKGPAKVVFQDSKVIFVRIGSIYYRVSANRLKKAGEGLAADIRRKEENDNTENDNTENDNTETDKNENIDKNVAENKTTTTIKSMRKPDSVSQDNIEQPDWHRLEMEQERQDKIIQDIVELDDEEIANIPTETENIDIEQREQPRQGRKRKKTNQKPTPEINEDGTIQNAAHVLKRNDRIEILEKGKWESGIVLGHGGKVGGKYAGWYNLKLDNGQVFYDEMSNRQVKYLPETQDESDEEEVFIAIQLDCGRKLKISSTIPRKIRFESEDDSIALLVSEEILAVMVPKEQRDSPECMAAKLEELNKLAAFDTYTIVDDEGQERITTTWVLTEKGTEKRARLTARGFQEETTFPTDSPTVQKHSMKLMLAISATEKWIISTTDITSAFLQGSEMDRHVYVKPPRESNQKGKLWLLNKCLYGLKDASRKWYLRVVEKLKNLGFQTSCYDSGLFFLIKDEKLIGIVALHVDDFLHAGSKYFNDKIMPQLLGCFKVGKSETKEFMYTGFYMKQDTTGVRIDQNKYVRNVQIPTIDVQQMKERDREMSQDELTLLRQMTGIVNWAARATRPDLSFDMIDLSTKFKGGKVEDLIKAKNVANRLKKDEVSILISDLENLKDCEMIVYTDAAFRNLNDNTDSCGGYLVVIANMKTGKIAPLEWKSGKLKRRVHSTLGAETQALYNGLDAAVGLKLLLKEMYSGKVDLDVKAVTDNKSARDAIYSESEVTERILRGDIAVIKQMVQNGKVKEIRWVTGENMLADILTKRGVNRISLLETLESGKLTSHALNLIKE